MQVDLPDFTRKSLEKAAIKEVLVHPGVVYGFGLSILAGLSIVIFSPSWFNIPVVLLGLAVSGATFITKIKTKYEEISRRHFTSLFKVIEDLKQKVTKNVDIYLEKIPQDFKYKALLMQAKNQLKVVESKYQAFQSILDEKFNRNEITYTRYMGSAEQIYIGVMEHLEQITSLVKNSQTIDASYVISQIGEIEKRSKPLPEDDMRELEALKKRLALFEDCYREIDRIVSHNEEALTSLELAKTALSNLKTTKGKAGAEFPDAMRDLEDLALRAKQYSHKS